MEKLEQRLRFNRGLHREYETEVEPNAAVELLNWQPQPDGSLVVRRKWEKAALSTVAAQKVEALAVMPVLAGWRTPIRRQRRKVGRASRTQTAASISWWDNTVEGSLLVAFVSYASDAAATSAIVVTPPAGWVPVATIHSNDAPSSLSMKAFVITDAAERDALTEETWAFDKVVRRVQIEIMEWRGIADVTPLDVTQVGSANSIKPDTQASAVTDPAFPVQLVLGAVAMKATSKSVKPEEFTDGYFPHTDSWDPPHFSTGANDYWLNMAVARNVVFTSSTQRFYATYASLDEEEDDIAGRNVAMLLTFKAKLRETLTDKDYLIAARTIDGTTHGIEAIDLDEVDTGAWVDVGTINARDGAAADMPLSIAVGPDGALFTARDVMSTPVAVHRGLFQWDGDDLLRINRSPRATVVQWHPPHHRFYAGGTKEYPQRLFWSEAGDPTTWDEDSWWDVGNNGEYVLDIASTQSGLIVAKKTGLYLFHGHAKPEGMSEITGANGMPGRCLCPYPGGVFVIGYNHIWRFDGGVPKLVSRALDDYWAGVDHPWTHTAYVDGLIKITGAIDDSIVVYDVANDHWWVDKPPEPLRVIHSVDGRRLYGGVENNIANLSVYFKDLPGSPRSLDDDGEELHGRTQDFMLGSPAHPITPRGLYVSYKKRNYQAGHDPMLVTPIYDGDVQTTREITEVHPVSGAVLGNGSFRIRLDVGVKDRSAAHRIAYQFDYVGDGVNTTCFDIEAVELVYDVEEMR